MDELSRTSRKLVPATERLEMIVDGAAADPYHLERFVVAQSPVYETVVRELRSGGKRTHWIWFIFPQLRGLGRSSTARYFGIDSLDEARAYLSHAVLAARLLACVHLMLEVRGRSLNTILGSPDDQKFRSSMTLFNVAADARDNVFRAALEQYCDGTADDQTLALLGAPGFFTAAH